jgi:hypothetical protein
MRELTDDEIPTVVALGRQITQNPAGDSKAAETARQWSRTGGVPLADPARDQPAES